MTRAWELWRADLALIGNTLIWGSTFVIVQQALRDASPLLFLGLRFSLATLALFVVFRGRVLGAPLRPAVRSGIMAGFCMFSGYVFQTFGLRLTTAPKSGFLTGLSIPLVPLLAGAVYKKAPRIAELAGIVLATAGMTLMVLQGEISEINRGDALTLAGAVAFAAHIVLVGHYSKLVSFEVLSTVQVATSAALSLSTFWWAETPVIRWSPRVLFAVAVTGLLATALAFTVQAWAQQFTTATRAALIFALEPVFAWLTSFVLTGETLSARAGLGAGLILCGIVLVEMKPTLLKQHPSK